MCDCGDLLKALTQSAEIFSREKDRGERFYVQGALRTIRPQSDTGSDIINGWHAFEFPRPAMLMPTTQPAGPIFAYPYEVPSEALNVDTLNQDVDEEISIRSVGGKLWIPKAGKWWIKYIATTPLVVAQIEGICGACAEQLKRPGIIATDQAPQTVQAAAAGNLASDNQLRDGVIIHNVGGSDIWVRLGDATAAPAAVGGPGWLVPFGETIALVGDLAWRGPVNARADGVDGSAYVVSVYG